MVQLDQEIESIPKFMSPLHAIMAKGNQHDYSGVWSVVLEGRVSG